MEKLEELTIEQREYAVDLMVMMVVEEIAKKTSESSLKLLPEFVSSRVGKLLYDEESKLWCGSPSVIANAFLKEK